MSRRDKRYTTSILLLSRCPLGMASNQIYPQSARSQPDTRSRQWRRHKTRNQRDKKRILLSFPQSRYLPDTTGTLTDRIEGKIQRSSYDKWMRLP